MGRTPGENNGESVFLTMKAEPSLKRTQAMYRLEFESTALKSEIYAYRRILQEFRTTAVWL